MKKLLVKHSSLLLIGISAFNFFILNIILKDFLNDIDYSLYSIFVTYLSFLVSLGLLGTDGTFIRISEYKDKLFLTNIKFLKFIFTIVLLSPLLYTFIIWKIYFQGLNFFYIFFITLVLLFTNINYNILRLKSNFFISQLINNFWKLLITIVIIVLFFLKLNFSFEIILNIFFILFAILLLINIFAIRKVKFENFKSPEVNIFSLSLQYLLSNFILTSMSFLDRFIVERNLGMKELATYFFLSNLFLYPFFIFQNYIGFKEVVSFKKEATIKILNSKIKSIIIFSIIFSIVLFSFCFSIDYFNFYKINILANINWIILMLILGIIRNIYSILSAAGGTLANTDFVKTLNKYSIFLFIILLTPYYFKASVEGILMIFILIWLLRVIIMYNLLKKEIIKRSQDIVKQI